MIMAITNKELLHNDETSNDEISDIALEELFANAKRNADNQQKEKSNEQQDVQEPINVTLDVDPSSNKKRDDIEAQTNSALQDSIRSWDGPPTPPRESKSRGVPSMVKELSSDVSRGGEGPPPISTLSTSKNSEDTSQKPYKKYIFRGVFIAVVLFIIILSASLFYARKDDNSNDNGDSTGGGNPSNITPSPPSSTSPQQPSTSPTLSPTETLIVDFETSAVFNGAGTDHRFGTIVSLNDDGNFMAALSLEGRQPIQLFQQGIDSDADAGWVPFPSLPVQGILVSSSLEVGAGLDVASTEEGVSVLAVSSLSGFEVYEYIGGIWARRGQSLKWESLDSIEEPFVSSTAISLSSDAAIMAAAYLSQSGREILVRVFSFDSTSQRWNQIGGPLSRNRPETSSPYLSLSLSLSGNGQVVTLGDWMIGDPQVDIESFEWRDNAWAPMGPSFFLPWGPAHTALSRDGKRLSIVNLVLGMVYEWDGDQWNAVGSGFSGGTSVSMSGAGSRVLVGDGLQNKGTVFDYNDGTWTSSFTATGSSSDRFGESISLSKNGNVFCIGAPFADSVGQVSLYG